jgi:hypothetical protein
MAYDGSVPPIDVEQSLANLKLERGALLDGTTDGWRPSPRSYVSRVLTYKAR